MEKELFNRKTIERLSSKIKPTKLQIKASKEWLNLLEEGKLKKEKLNYFRFGEIILKELLGYDIKDMSFEEGFIEFSFNTYLGIEAKGTATIDLFAEQKGYKKTQKTPIDQLWRYMGKIPLDYGIATNYKDFVLLDRTKGSSTFHHFNFEDISENENKLKEFIAIFSREQIIDKKFIEELKHASKIEEQNFTKEFYKIYHETRLMLIKEFQQNGQSNESSIHYAQLFLNRLMFVFFAEDTDKIDQRLFEDLVISRLEIETLLSNHSTVISDAMIVLFKTLNSGSNTPRKIFGFNGGLFAEDIPRTVFFYDFKDKDFFNDVYLNSKIKTEPKIDEISQPLFDKYQNKLNPIIKNLLIMASFDFTSEVSVNILGHIFEQSLGDIEALQEDKESKRKKDGIYYTPEYITDFICRNTIIPYLSKSNVNTPRELILDYSDDIGSLEDKFANLKIVDPACGSGAFLIKAIDVLLEIHKEMQIFKQDSGQYTAKRKGKNKKDDKQLMLIKWNEEDEAREIIRNNIYGVDINEESVDITKLSLFLKIADKNKKLLQLSNNIKCGNSLIDDSNYSDNSFNWKFQFKDVFAKGGFDIVIGNPPYVNSKEINERDREYFWNHYSEVLMMDLDLYEVFTYSTIHNILKDNGYFGFITPHSYYANQSFEKYREYLLKNTQIINIVDFPYRYFPFEEVNLETAILILTKKQIESQIINVNIIDRKQIDTLPISFHNPNQIKPPIIPSSNQLFINMSKVGMAIVSRVKDRLIFDEYFKVSNPSSLDRKIRYPQTNQKKYDKCVFNAEDLRADSELKKIVIPCIEGGNILRYLIHGEEKFTNSTWKVDGKLKQINAKTLNNMKQRKLVGQRITGQAKQRIVFTYDENEYITMPSVNIINATSSEKSDMLFYLLALLNSSLYNFLYQDIYGESNTNITSDVFSTIPIVIPSEDDKKILIAYVKELLEITKAHYTSKEKLIKDILLKHNFDKVTMRLRDIEHTTFEEFVEEIINIGKIDISTGKERRELENYWKDIYEEDKEIIQAYKNQMNSIEYNINHKIYELYKLTNKEIGLINIHNQ